MDRLQGNDLLIGAYIDTLRRKHGDKVADKISEIYEKQRAVIEAEEIVKMGDTENER